MNNNPEEMKKAETGFWDKKTKSRTAFGQIPMEADIRRASTRFIPSSPSQKPIDSHMVHTMDEEWADGVLLNRAKQSVFKAARCVPGLTLVIKPHPRENAAETRKLARALRHWQ